MCYSSAAGAASRCCAKVKQCVLSQDLPVVVLARVALLKSAVECIGSEKRRKLTYWSLQASVESGGISRPQRCCFRKFVKLVKKIGDNYDITSYISPKDVTSSVYQCLARFKCVKETDWSCLE